MEEVMIEEVAMVDALKRGTWGVDALHVEFGGVIPKGLIAQVRSDDQAAAMRQVRRQVQRYEFVARDVAWSDDFIKVLPSGRVLRVQDEFSRVVFGFEHRDRWPDIDVAHFVHEAMRQYGPPYFFKHDLGTEFTGGIFQAMLRGAMVIALPSPLKYPSYNGKHERTNLSVRYWLKDTETDRFPLKRVLEEIALSLVDHNQLRLKEVLGGRTPQEAYESSVHVEIDRRAMYNTWEALRQSLLERLRGKTDNRLIAETKAMRIAALVVLRWNNLVRYFNEPESPKVST